jgi:hypothetical protein
MEQNEVCLRCVRPEMQIGPRRSGWLWDVRKWVQPHCVPRTGPLSGVAPWFLGRTIHSTAVTQLLTTAVTTIALFTEQEMYALESSRSFTSAVRCSVSLFAPSAHRQRSARRPGNVGDVDIHTARTDGPLHCEIQLCYLIPLRVPYWDRNYRKLIFGNKTKT